jgi:hypothetical protein
MFMREVLIGQIEEKKQKLQKNEIIYSNKRNASMSSQTKDKYLQKGK